MPAAPDYDIIDLYVVLSYGSKDALRVSGSLGASAANLLFVANDKFRFRIRFYSEPSSEPLPIAFDELSVIQANAGTTESDEILFLTPVFVKVVAGWDIYYEAIVNTETLQVAQLMATVQEASVWFSIQVSNAVGIPATKRRTVVYSQATLLADRYNDSQVGDSEAVYPELGSSDIEFTASTMGLIFRSQDNSRWKMTVDNNGVGSLTKL